MLISCGVGVGENAPSIELKKPTATIRAGEPFEVGIVASWTGDSERFVVSPGNLVVPSWGEAAWDRVEASKTSDGVALRYVAKFTAKAPGTVAIPELHLVYTDPTEPLVEGPPEKLTSPPKELPGHQPNSSDPNAPQVGASTPGATTGVDDVYRKAPDTPKVAPTHTIKAEAFEVNVRADYRWTYKYVFFGVMFLGLVIAGASIEYGRRKNAKEVQREDPLAPWRTVEEALHNARRHRLDGDFYTFYRELQRLVKFVGGEVKSEFGAKIDKRVEEIGFQNQTPTEDELEGIVRDLERALARWKEGRAA
nr:hypothetical protein [uncultured bacterium]